ncbi:MAG TPA: hypothetical protein VFE04_07095 [Puia sp.]|nr:hypothetical protein [Puia sp.]
MIALVDILTGLIVIILSALYFRKILADKDRKHTIALLLIAICFYAPVVLAAVYFLVVFFTGSSR